MSLFSQLREQQHCTIFTRQIVSQTLPTSMCNCLQPDLSICKTQHQAIGNILRPPQQSVAAQKPFSSCSVTMRTMMMTEQYHDIKADFTRNIWVDRRSKISSEHLLYSGKKLCKHEVSIKYCSCCYVHKSVSPLSVWQRASQTDAIMAACHTVPHTMYHGDGT